MTAAPEVQPLPKMRRKYLFLSLFIIFCVLLPIIMFYATGYRFHFDGENRNIVSTGGLYVSASADDVQIFVDEEPVRNLRVFRRASYIQNLGEGTHRLNVQGEGLHIWTKDVPVYPHIVTEAEAFNMPLIPQIRIVTPYISDTGESVVFVATSTERVFSHASTSNLFLLATSTATTTYNYNPEYEYVVSLFGTSSATSTSLVDRVVTEVEEAFNFATVRATTSTSSATTTKILNDVVLFVRGEDIFVRWLGTPGAGPYYYCIDHVAASTTIDRYGQHVYDSIRAVLASSTKENIMLLNGRMRVCRDEIRIDRKWQNVLDFDFFPDSVDLILLMLEDGLYVVEADDRSWQNTQLLYPGSGLRMVVDGGRIYLYDGKEYFEVFTELIAS